MAKKSRALAWGLLGLAIQSALAVIIIGIVIQHIRYRTAGFPTNKNITPTFVTITAQDEGTQGDPIYVETSAFGKLPFLSMELWINGILEGVHAAPSGGLTSFNPDFVWIPNQPGAYSLVARGLDAENQSATSLPITVLIKPAESEEDTDEFADSAAVFPAASTAAAVPQLPGTNDTTSPAASWQGSAIEWVTNLTANEPPNAPALILKEEGCVAKILIHDLSDNEEGFAIYRQTPNAPTWTQIALLSSQSQDDWLTFSDSGTPGGLTYYVTAFNSQGEAASNLALVNIDPAGCPSVEGELPLLTVELTTLVPSFPVDQVYCYKSLDGLNWSRWPLFGFFTMGEKGLEIQETGENLLLSDFNDQPVIQELDLMMECWGWSGAQLQFLGEFSEHLDLSGPKELHIPTDGFSVDILLKFADYFDQPVFYPMGGGGDDLFFDLSFLKNIWKFFKPIHPQISHVHTVITMDQGYCMYFLPGEPWMTEEDRLAYCAPYPGFDIGPSGGNPQRYLVFYSEKKCQAGGDCLTYQDLADMVTLEGGKVGFYVTSKSSAGFKTWVVDTPGATVFTLPPVACEGKQYISVRMWYSQGDKTYWGPISGPIKVSCFKPLGDKVQVEVTFETLHIGHADDNDVGQEKLEIYGYFLAESSVDFKYVVRGNLIESNWSKYCFSDFTLKGLGCPATVWNGSWPITKFENCIDGTKGAKVCQGTVLPDMWATNTNKFTMDVADGDAIRLRVVLIDYDYFADDYVCSDELYTPKKDIFEWNKTYNEEWQLKQSDNGHASCKVDVVITRVIP